MMRSDGQNGQNPRGMGCGCAGQQRGLHVGINKVVGAFLLQVELFEHVT